MVLLVASFAFAAQAMKGTGTPLDVGAWRIAANSSLGPSTLVALIGLLLLAVPVPPRWQQIVLALGILVSAGSFALTGHAAATQPRALMGSLITLHVMLAAFWFGSLWSLMEALRSAGPAERSEVVDQFSRWALWLVPALLVAGGIMVWTYSGSLEALGTSAYGQALAWKLGGVAILLGFAAFHKFKLAPDLAAHTPGAAARLRVSIGLEAGVMVLVIAISAVLAETSPPRAHAAASTASELFAAGPAIEIRLQGQRLKARLRITPRPGTGDHVELELRDLQGAPLMALQVGATFSNPAAGIDQLQVPLAASTQRGTYSAEAPGLSADGSWQVSIEVLVSDFESERAASEFVRGAPGASPRPPIPLR
jgi:putative copper export protein